MLFTIWMVTVVAYFRGCDTCYERHVTRDNHIHVEGFGKVHLAFTYREDLVDYVVLSLQTVVSGWHELMIKRLKYRR
jgi:hypothetical protein